MSTGSCNIIFKAAGSETLTATYAGSTNYAGSTSASFPVNVN